MSQGKEEKQMEKQEVDCWCILIWKTVAKNKFHFFTSYYFSSKVDAEYYMESIESDAVEAEYKGKVLVSKDIDSPATGVEVF